MSERKSTQIAERKTLEHYVVETFPCDPEITVVPLTVMRSGQDEKGVRLDGGWIPGEMSYVCDTDSEGGVSEGILTLQVYKPVKIEREGRIYYDILTKNISLEKIQEQQVNAHFTDDYIHVLFGMTPEEMRAAGKRKAEEVWEQKHPANNDSESSTTETRQNFSDDSAAKEVSGHERPSTKEVSSMVGDVAVEAAGVRKPVEANKVDTNEPVRKPVEKDKTGAGSSILAMTKDVMASIGAIKVNDPASLAATEAARGPMEMDRVNADLVDLLAVESAEKSVETNEANTGILPEGFKVVIDNFKQLAEENNGQFSGLVTELNANLSQLRESIKRKPAAIEDSRITEFITIASLRIRELEDSRSESANKFKNDVSGLIEDLKKKIKNGVNNDDEKSGRLIKLTEGVDKMSDDSTTLGNTTKTLIDKLTEIVRIVSDAQNDRWGMDGHIGRMVTVIGEIVDSDLPSVYRHRQGILAAVEAIKTTGGQ